MTIDDYEPMTMDELRREHLFSGASLADQPITAGLPDGWRIITRKWGFRSWDALIQSDRCFGWALSGPMASTERKATKRSEVEIRTHIAGCKRCAASRSTLWE